MRHLNFSIVITILLVGLTASTSFASKPFVAPSVFLNAFSGAYKDGLYAAADAIILTYRDIAEFAVENSAKTSLTQQETRYIDKVLKGGKIFLLSDRRIVNKLVGTWKSKDKKILVYYDRDGSGIVKYPRKDYPFTWLVANATIDFKFNGESTSDKVIFINDDHYVYKGGDTGKLDFLFKTKPSNQETAKAEAAKQKQAVEWYEEGMKYYFGDGVEHDVAKAMALLHKAADSGNADAQGELGGFYLIGGSGVRRDYGEAAKWVHKAVAQENSVGIYYLGVMHETGDGAEQDYAQAARIYAGLIKKKSAVQISAQQRLGQLYLEGHGVRQDLEKAEYYLRKATDSSQRAAHQHVLGKYYEQGAFGRVDLDRARKYYSLAAEQGHSDAATYLAALSDRVARKAAEDKAINQISLEGIGKVKGGYSLAEVLSNSKDLCSRSVRVRGRVVKFTSGIMGANWLHLRDGSGGEGTNDLTVTTQDNVKIGDLVVVEGVITCDKDFGSGYTYEVIMEDAEVEVESAKPVGEAAGSNAGASAPQGKETAESEAVSPEQAVEWYELAKDYYSGVGGRELDKAKAIALARKAADAGNADAQVGVGFMYETGDDGVDVDFAEAVKWYRRAAEQGDPVGRFSLGRMYETGQGVEQDYEKAARLYSEVAEEESRARHLICMQLGNLYLDGKGVARDPKKAEYYWQLAASSGYSWVVDQYKELSRRGAFGRSDQN